MFAAVQILTGEDWNIVMYDGIQAYGGIKVNPTPLYIFNNFLSYFILLQSPGWMMKKKKWKQRKTSDVREKICEQIW